MPEMKCEKCGQKLVELPWNSGSTIRTCGNSCCRAYRNPVSIYVLYRQLIGEKPPPKVLLK
jgi:hypothetical protein